MPYKHLKKTLLALMALAGVAGAALTKDGYLTDISGDNNSYTWSGSPDSAAITLILTGKAIAGINRVNDAYDEAFASFNLTGGSLDRLAIIHYRSGGVDKFYTADTVIGTSWGDNKTEVFTTNVFEGHSAWETAEYAALTFAIGKTGSTYTVLSVIDSAGTITNIGAAAVDTGVTYSSISSSLVNKNGAVSEAYFYTGAWTADSLKQLTASTLQTKLVPEPTTATLSLLALAGLAARRRRR